MSTEPEMSDAKFTNVFSILIGGLIVLTIALIILAVIISSGVNQSDINAQNRDRQVIERIAPVGQITVGEVDSAQTADSGSGDTGAGEAAAGDAIYETSCAACHASGVAGAPTFGDEAAWSGRMEKGIDTLYSNAIDGFQGETGVMPPKGGNTSLSDEEVKAAVDYMVEQAE